MNDIRRIHEDFTEIVARVILHKDRQAKGEPFPCTDDWREIYSDNKENFRLKKEITTDIKYCVFRAEVRGVVAALMNKVRS